MSWIQWTLAVSEAVLLVVLILLWMDRLREKPGGTPRSAARRALPWFAAVPVGFVAVALAPVWLGLILVAAPLLAIIAMALAS